MAWMFVVMITFSCVMFIHMELVDALLKVLDMEDKDIPIITCPKCLSFQCVFWFLLLTGHNVIVCIATAFLASYCAIWFDLFLGFYYHKIGYLLYLFDRNFFLNLHLFLFFLYFDYFVYHLN